MLHSLWVLEQVKARPTDVSLRCFEACSDTGWLQLPSLPQLTLFHPLAALLFSCFNQQRCITQNYTCFYHLSPAAMLLLTTALHWNEAAEDVRDANMC